MGIKIVKIAIGSTPKELPIFSTIDCYQWNLEVRLFHIRIILKFVVLSPNNQQLCHKQYENMSLIYNIDHFRFGSFFGGTLFNNKNLTCLFGQKNPFFGVLVDPLPSFQIENVNGREIRLLVTMTSESNFDQSYLIKYSEI